MIMAFSACKKKKDSSLDAADLAQGQSPQYSVSWYDIGGMPVECPAPAGVDITMGIAVVEGDPLIDGLTCGGKKNSAGYPACSEFIANKKICGRIFTVKNPATGRSIRGYFSGICPWDHPANVPKGKWNPCGRGRRHLDLMVNAYRSLGLTDAQSWGQNGYQDSVNPQAAYLTVTVDKSKEGLKTCEQLRGSKGACNSKVFQ